MNTVQSLLQIARMLTALGFLVLPLNTNKKPCIKWERRREIPLTPDELINWFSSDGNGNCRAKGIGIALRGKDVVCLAMDTDGVEATRVFEEEFLPTCPEDIQDAFRKTTHTKTPSRGGHWLIGINPGEYPKGIKQETKWADIKIEIAGQNHSQINLMGTEHMLREHFPGYISVRDINCKVDLPKERIEILLTLLAKFKLETGALKIIGNCLKPYYVNDNRNELVFATSGYLWKYGKVPKDLTIRLFTHIMRVTAYNDEDWEKTLATIEATYNKDPTTEEVSGKERLLAAVGGKQAVLAEIEQGFKMINPEYFPNVTFNGNGSSNNTYTCYNGRHIHNKEKILVSIGRPEIMDGLEENIWTMTSESPPKFIVASKRLGYICRMSITYSDSNDSASPTKKAHLNYGTALIRLFPKRVVMHESPLKFLETPPHYTIRFENQKGEEFEVSGTIETIVSRLKEMPGYVVSPYGVTEALTAMIGAFSDDMKLEVDKSVDFEGYYYHDGEIQVSRINLDKKHPRRTKEEVVECIKYLDERSRFQIWDYKGQKIDRCDLLASAIQWTIPGPFNFAMKQLGCKPYLKGFDMTGERDGGKSDLSEEMLNVHGNPTNEQDADSIYSVSAGSTNTEAKFGKAVSRSTYPLEISEFGKAESYGRREDLVEPVKTSVDGLIVRRGKKDNRNDAPFASLSPLIINGNPPFSFKGELLKRFHIIRFSEEDRHDRDPKSPFNTFQKQNKHLMKIMGDWTVRYIYDNRHELILSRKYNPYEVGRIALQEFYKFGGYSEVHEWLTRWITDTALDELDQDIESVIRSILYNHVHRTLRDNSNIVLPKEQGCVTAVDRIGLCLDNGFWPWIRKISGSESRYYINTSVMELFSSRLPDLTFKKLAEKTCFKYVKDWEGRAKLECTKKQLDDFIVGTEEDEISTSNPYQHLY
jgi:hypothetical protein